MERISFVFTICFVLLGPIKVIPAFAKLTKDADSGFRRRVSVLGIVIAAAMCLLVLVMGGGIIDNFELSLEALQLGGGLVLLLSALGVIFPRADTKPQTEKTPGPLQLAIAPVAMPIIVTPAGIAALLILVMVAPAHPGMYEVLGVILLVILSLDFLAMLFNHSIVRVPGLLPTLQVAGSVLVFVQVALAVDVMLKALRTLGVTGE